MIGNDEVFKNAVKDITLFDLVEELTSGSVHPPVTISRSCCLVFASSLRNTIFECGKCGLRIPFRFQCLSLQFYTCIVSSMLFSFLDSLVYSNYSKFDSDHRSTTSRGKFQSWYCIVNSLSASLFIPQQVNQVLLTNLLIRLRCSVRHFPHFPHFPTIHSAFGTPMFRSVSTEEHFKAFYDSTTPSLKTRQRVTVRTQNRTPSSSSNVTLTHASLISYYPPFESLQLSHVHATPTRKVCVIIMQMITTGLRSITNRPKLPPSNRRGNLKKKTRRRMALGLTNG